MTKKAATTKAATKNVQKFKSPHASKFTERGTELPIIDLRGKPYLQVAHRIVWFREEHPDWTIETNCLDRGEGWAVFRAQIKDVEGRLMASGHKAETKKGFQDFLEKAETGSVGRALALCGYGTQFEPDFDERDRLADAPLSVEGDTSYVPIEPIDVERILKAFAPLGVARDKLEKFLEVDLKDCNEDHRSKLNDAYKTLKKGEKVEGLCNQTDEINNALS